VWGSRIMVEGRKAYTYQKLSALCPKRNEALPIDYQESR